MKANIITIGNSQGIRIPKVLLDQSGLRGEVELELCDSGLLIRHAKRARENWSEGFKQMAENHDEADVEDFAPSKYAKENWRW